MGSVEDRGNGSYRLSVVIGYDNKGKAIRERMTVKAKGIKDARLKLAEFEMTIRGGTYVKPEKMTLSQFYDDWLHKYAEKELGHDTRTKLCQHTKHPNTAGIWTYEAIRHQDYSYS